MENLYENIDSKVKRQNHIEHKNCLLKKIGRNITFLGLSQELRYKSRLEKLEELYNKLSSTFII